MTDIVEIATELGYDASYLTNLSCFRCQAVISIDEKTAIEYVNSYGEAEYICENCLREEMELWEDEEAP